METQQYFTLKEVQLHNNCPECYSSDGLELTFKQKFVENIFYKAITEYTKYDMYCSTCQTDIYPIRWTDDIEQVVNYQKRALKPKPKSFKLKQAGWIFVIVDVLLFITVLLFINGILSF